MTTPTPDPGDEMRPEELERLRQRLAAPSPPDGVLDRARAAALDAFDETHAKAPSAAVRDIGSARPAPRPTAWYQRVPLGAAAAIVAVVALVGVFSQIDVGGDDDDTATADDSGDSGDFEDTGAALESADDGDERLGDESASRDSLGGGTGGAGDASAEAPAADGALVLYEDVDAVVDSLRMRYSAADPQASEPAPSTTSTAVAEFDREVCDAYAAAGIEPSTVLSQELVVLGTADDQAVAIVVVYDSDETGLRVAVVDEASCSLLADRAL